MAITVEIHTGESITKEDSPSHPLKAAIAAREYIDCLLDRKPETGERIDTNNSDYVSTMYYYIKENKHPIEVRLFLNETEVSDLEPIFKDWNRAYTYQTEICNLG